LYDYELGTYIYLETFDFLPEEIGLALKEKVVKASGQNIEFRGDSIFAKSWETIKGVCQYNAYFKTPLGSPFLFIKDTNYSVASWIKYNEGYIFFIPGTVDDSDTHFHNFVAAAKSLTDGITVLSGGTSMPEWANNYISPEEAALRGQLIELNDELRRVTNAIGDLEIKIQEAGKYKILLYGTGVGLEEQVTFALEEIGFTVQRGINNRNDLLLKYGEKTGVVEVKGVSKSAAEKHAAQLEKWVSEYFAETGILPKGFLIINTFNQVDPRQRTEASFPNQMIKYSTSRNHCLLTTVQIFNILLYIRIHPEEKEKIINSLFENVGEYNMFKNI